MFDIQKFTDDLLAKRLSENENSMKVVAKQIGISVSVYARLECGQIPAIELLTKCSVWSGINLYTLFKMAENSNTKQLQKVLLKKRLQKENITPHNAARQIGISRNVYVRLERGILPSVESMVKCFAWLNTKDMDYFQDSS